MQLSIIEEDPRSEDACSLMEELSVILKGITGDSGKSSFNIEDLKNSKSFFLIARNESREALGCGSIRYMEDKVGEVKRTYARSPGVGSAVLKELENKSIGLGYEILKLETRKINKKAIDFYLKNGYQTIANYGKYIGNEKAICFQKNLKIIEVSQ